MANKNKATVRIYGQEYKVMGEASIEHLEKVAKYVDGKMNDISSKLPILDASKISVLTAVNIASELFKLQEEYNELLKLVDEQTKE
jgi:cell division protein ZapA